MSAAARVTLRWLFTRALDVRARLRHEALLDADERARHARLRRADDRAEFAAAHALLRSVLSDSAAADAPPPAAWRFERDAGGKPRVRSDLAGTPPLSFSLSHTRGVVACAVARGIELGVDAECVDRRTEVDLVAARVCSPDERHQLAEAGSAGLARFIELWTLKEACAKGLGVGVAMQLDHLSFDLRHRPDIRAALPPEHGTWTFALYPLAVPDGRQARVAVAARVAGTAALAIDAGAADSI